MHPPQPLEILSFDEERPDCFRQPRQGQYLWRYLAGLKAATIIEEPGYFDRDWLADLSYHYAYCAASYPNLCRRLHFFSAPVSREQLDEALGGGEAAGLLRRSYLGFSVVRPLPEKPLGRTVLAWYPESLPERPRIIGPSRVYTAHLAGLPLEVQGLAWQQQDTNVSVCATVAVWSMSHSSAFDERHAVPTAAQVALAARRSPLQTPQIYPTKGMSLGQAINAVEGLGLRPVTVGGDLPVDHPKGRLVGFSHAHFAARLSTFLNSGYVVMLLGALLRPKGHAMHALCAVGFRPSRVVLPAANGFAALDGGLDRVYLHDDNIGPAARFRVEQLEEHGSSRPVVLRCEPPSGAHHAAADADGSYPLFLPTSMLVAVQPELRLGDTNLFELATNLARDLSSIIKRGSRSRGLDVLIGLKFIHLRDYMGPHLEQLFGRSMLLARVRRALVEKVSPMSYFLGIIRFAVATPAGPRPALEVLVDTSSSTKTPTMFAHLLLDAGAGPYAAQLTRRAPGGLGVPIEGYERREL